VGRHTVPAPSSARWAALTSRSFPCTSASGTSTFPSAPRATRSASHGGGKGIITLKRTDKTGDVVALKEVIPGDELMVITKHGVIIRLPVDDIRVIGQLPAG
jgi:DNA gyrase/topoisomerase IV subunit A